MDEEELINHIRSETGMTYAQVLPMYAYGGRLDRRVEKHRWKRWYVLVQSWMDCKTQGNEKALGMQRRGLQMTMDGDVPRSPRRLDSVQGYMLHTRISVLSP